ncbi:unnamed protein product [Chrysoparadoxa australica]
MNPPPPPPRPPPSSYVGLMHSIALTPAKTPKLLEEEVQILQKKGVSIFALKGSEYEAVLENGTATLTTHRVLWRGDSTGGGVFFHLSQVRQASAVEKGVFRSSSRIDIVLVGQGVSDIMPAVQIKVKPGRDEFLQRLEEALARQAWVKESVKDVVDKYAGQITGAGIAGILKRQEMNRKVTSQIAQDAFADMDSLIVKAKEVVAVIERYQSAAGEGESKDENDMQNVLMNIGLVAPVTKGSSGTQYHQLLAHQLCDFLRNRGLLAHFGGMMTLTDAFAMFNRARGAELVSPQDLLAAAELLKVLGLGMCLRSFDSGVLVIQLDSHNDSAVSQSLSALAEEAPLDTTRVSLKLNVSMSVATEHLRTAERLALLCRDESLQGLRFYKNIFDSFELAS